MNNPTVPVPEEPPPGRWWSERLFWFWQGGVLPAFWTIGSLFSLALNIILIVLAILFARQLFGLKAVVESQLVGGLHTNFVKMDQAHIRTTVQVDATIQVQDMIQVQDEMPVMFELPLDQSTEVVLTKNAEIGDATVVINGSKVNMPITLRKGTRLNIGMQLTVPVSQTIPVALNVPVNLSVPVHLTVPVDIPLNQTELHEPFTGLQNVVSPYQRLLSSLPNSWEETAFCRQAEWLCGWLFK